MLWCLFSFNSTGWESSALHCLEAKLKYDANGTLSLPAVLLREHRLHIDM